MQKFKWSLSIIATTNGLFIISRGEQRYKSLLSDVFRKCPSSENVTLTVPHYYVTLTQNEVRESHSSDKFNLLIKTICALSGDCELKITRENLQEKNE